MTTVAATTALDWRGKTITTFVVFDAAAELAKMREGEVLELVTDDFEPFTHDVAAWCDTAGHRLVSSEVTKWHESGTPAFVRADLARGGTP